MMQSSSKIINLDKVKKIIEKPTDKDFGYNQFKSEIKKYDALFGIKKEILDYEVRLCQIAHIANELKRYEISKYHGFEHNIRVARYCDLIMHDEKFPPSQFDMYLFAYLHDIGRKSDGHEPNHGMISAEMAKLIIENFWPEADITSVVWAIEHHSHIKEANMIINGNGNLSGTIPDNIDLRIFYIGGDSDQLELYRDPIYQKKGLNSKYFNTVFGKSFVNKEQHKRIYRH